MAARTCDRAGRLAVFANVYEPVHQVQVVDCRSGTLDLRISKWHYSSADGRISLRFVQR